ncbi:Hypothetical predicted protein [Paramuricea clavata]|uniref:Neurexin/syndecan/glycophorin C domain-containing protein n=1 Tax=Paramuricea clavata TaxID=317549 RepID=A0A6S7GJ93_PARCT|nr:Hypothetical predicted protein [Paramuricea clavata]
MRGVILVALFGYLAVVLYAESEPTKQVSSGSGDGIDDQVIYITPTNGTKPPTDSTDDYGSGVDDEDDEDYGSGSAMSSTTETFTTETLTTETPTTVRESTTTEEETTTEAAATSTTTIITPDDDDYYSGSGSGSGVSSTRPQDETTTASTDIYISTETSTVDDVNALITRVQNNIVTTAESTKQESTRSLFKTTQKPASTTPPRVPMTDSWTRESATTTTTTESVETTTQASTSRLIKTEETTTEQYRGQSTEEKGINKLWTSTKFTTKQSVETTTPSEPAKMALTNNKKEPGFTLTTEVIAGVVGCALLALLLIAFLMYRLKKRDEGSYLLDESNAYPVDYKKFHVSDKEAFI